MNTTTILHGKNTGKRSLLIKCLLYWAAFIIAILISNPLSGFFPKAGRPVVMGILGSLSALAITYYFLKREGKPFADIGLFWDAKTITKFMGGFLIGSILFLCILFCLLTFSGLTLKPHAPAINWASLMWAVASFIPLAFMEEIAFRSYPFVRLKSGYGLRTAFYVTAVAFALYHLTSGMNVISCFLGPGIWAFVFCLATEWSGGIALATGLHLALNVQQGIFGMKIHMMQPVWELVPKQASNGAAYANSDTIGLITQFAVLLTSILLVEWTIKQQRKHIKTALNS